MTKRILLALLAFTAVVLAGAVVPLTLSTIEQDQSSFIQDTVDMASADVSVAQPRVVLREPAQAPPIDFQLLNLYRQVDQAGDGLLIYLNSGQLLGSTGQVPAGQWGQVAAQVHDAGQAITETAGSQAIAAVPVFNEGSLAGTVIGTVILARSNAPLEHEIVELWVIFGTICVVAMIGAAVLAFGLARWVSRPLKGLDAAARRLADGDLEMRAKVESGPPELRRLGTTFNTMAGRLEALVHGHRAVIADVSHQLRTPLAALRLRLDLLAADTAHSDPDTGHELAGALDELARLSRLVDGLLTVARAENVVPVPVAIDVADVARERVVAWHPVADDRNIALLATSAGGSGSGARRLAGGFSGASGGSGGGPVLAWIGEGHLEQILDNLIANSLEALSPGHLVTLTATATPSGARITVSDNGPGMNAEDRERAFLRFTSMSPGGTGLGLAIVHRLVTSNGGTASLAGTPGGGLTVTLDFPGAPAPNSSAPANTATSTTASPHDVISL
ncbi:MAG TPA: HAMP domain-containing sensor histidine kinase [Streptosporangiaceae bacterium]